MVKLFFSVGDVAFVFVCQNHETSVGNCKERSEGLGGNVVLTTDFELDGDWTIFPLISLYV